MLQVDAKRRPRVEDLEALPAMQSSMQVAKSIFSEFKVQRVRQFSTSNCLHSRNGVCILLGICFQNDRNQK